MAESKNYLNVPYAQKDTAKALGTKWDAAYKKWYVPAGKDISLFAQWQTESAPLESLTKSTRTQSPASSKSGFPGVITYPEDKNFVAYNGDEPPWN